MKGKDEVVESGRDGMIVEEEGVEGSDGEMDCHGGFFWSEED